MQDVKRNLKGIYVLLIISTVVTAIQLPRSYNTWHWLLLGFQIVVTAFVTIKMFPKHLTKTLFIGFVSLSVCLYFAFGAFALSAKSCGEWQTTGDVLSFEGISLENTFIQPVTVEKVIPLGWSGFKLMEAEFIDSGGMKRIFNLNRPHSITLTGSKYYLKLRFTRALNEKSSLRKYLLIIYKVYGLPFVTLVER